MLKLVQQLKCVCPCDPEINSGRRKGAFTLAEVLITLGIIGVVAAITIPILVNNYQKQEYVVGLKKAYSEVNQAITQLTNDYGCPNDLQCTGLFSSSLVNPYYLLGQAFLKYFKVIKDCGLASNQGCFAAATNYYYDGTSPNNKHYDNSNLYTFITADGMSFYIENYHNDCSTSNYSLNITGDMTQTCGMIIIDINGLKKPNTWGRDTFIFFITNGKGAKIYPMGGADDNYDSAGGIGNYWWSNSDGTPGKCYTGNKWGQYCAGRIIEEGWKMNY